MDSTCNDRSNAPDPNSAAHAASMGGRAGQPASNGPPGAPCSGEANPLDYAARPAMPYDLCDVFPVGAGDDCPAEVTMALPRPPFGKYHEDRNTIEVTPTRTVNVGIKRRGFSLTVALRARGDKERIVSQVRRAVCAEALHAANLEVMRALREVRPEPGARCNIGTLLGLATRLCGSHPYPQFPSGVAFLLPSGGLSPLLLDHGTHVSLDTGRAAPRVFLNGVEAIAYDDFMGGQEGGASTLAYVMPRHGSVGLVMSEVDFRVTDKGDRLDFEARCNMGAFLSPAPMFCAVA